MKNNNIYSVSQVTKYIKLVLKDDVLLNGIFIEGEVTNFKEHSSGNLFFSIKDDESLINCIIYSQNVDNLDFSIKDGLKVICFGYISLYEKIGQYQFYVESIEQKGKGDLYLEYENTKEKLEKQGLFDKSKKKGLPSNPQNIIIITSETGAVIHDIINVANRRNPTVKLTLIPTLVQGEKAKEEIIKSIELANEWNSADLIILARGGGSFEDLFVFNEEDVAKAIFNSNLPVVSAIGHETDFTITDFVADFRAPTPSAAAEICIPNLDNFNNKINNYIYKIEHTVLKNLKDKNNILRFNLDKIKLDLILKKVDFKYKILNDSLIITEEKLNSRIKQYNLILKNKIEKLENKSPMNILKKGYTLTYSSRGNLLNSKTQVKKDEVIKIKFFDGDIDAKIIK